ncbi:MAG TPA: flagellar cap protein, partial [Chromatiales bacterium]|nr:flagellar cap protein [Chromatiales bacterium]
MPALTAPGIGSGLDINGIVTKLMEVERLPLQRLESQEKQVKEQLSAFGQFKSALSSFKEATSGLSTVSRFKIY